MAEMKLIVQKINRIEAHDNADRLAIAFTDTFDWPIIVGKDSFKPGDKVVHFPVDVCVDEKMEDILLGGSKIKLSKGRVRAAKIRGVISYGILCPWETIDEAYAIPKYHQGLDLMKSLGCHKFEPPVKEERVPGQQKGQIVRKGNVHFDKYFNMNHLQNCKGVFEGDDEVFITEKLHGTSFRAGTTFCNNGGFWSKTWRAIKQLFGAKNVEYEFVYGSRNVQLQNNKYDNSVYKQIVEKYNLRDIPNGVVLYGEIVGPGIQGGYKYTDEPSLFIYDMKVDGEYVDVDTRQSMTDMMDLDDVPSKYRGPWLCAELINLISDGSAFNEVIEGLVIETTKFEVGKTGRKKVKFLNPEYLLNKENTDFH